MSQLSRRALTVAVVPSPVAVNGAPPPANPPTAPRLVVSILRGVYSLVVHAISPNQVQVEEFQDRRTANPQDANTNPSSAAVRARSDPVTKVPIKGAHT
ncbi:hypothetical protein M407DRAFT_33202 [Tulasnella calospora MUT 4182]|uniref:Uncharacterized protein n=1 Tax=Tulasnella calospora MUT 4182 TaxID=1051891 RepID=A0A0C3L6F9_9AGAM|nr:hypothetical protein M407DRAFT_33202 [Tulasnella calospora MUT 4182]